MIGLLVSGPLIRTYGWPSVFYLFAVLGLLWSVAWPTLNPGDSDPTAVVAPRPSANSGSEPSGPSLPIRLALNCCLQLTQTRPKVISPPRLLGKDAEVY